MIGRATTATGLRIQSGTLPVVAHRLPLPDWIAFAVADAEDHSARGVWGGRPPDGSPARNTHTTHTHTFNGPFSGTTRVSWYQKGKTNLDFIEARDSEWQWHQLGHMQVCTLLQTDNHTSISPLCFLQAGCPSCRPTNSVKAQKALGVPPETGVLTHCV